MDRTDEAQGRTGAALMLVVLGAVLLTTGVLALQGAASEESGAFLRNDRTMLWAVLLCVQSALWAVLGTSLLRSHGRIRRRHFEDGVGRELIGRLAISIVVVVALASAFALIGASLIPEYPLAHRSILRAGLSAVGFFVMALAITGMWLVEASVGSVRDAPPEQQLARYLGLRGELHDVLGAAAAIIGMTILVGAGLRGAILDAVAGARFPAEYLLYYGAYYSALLALAYSPAHVAFRRVGLELRDRLQPFPSAGAQPWAQWYADRKALESLLELNLSNSRTLQTGLAIATPVLGSAFGLLLGIGT